MAGVLETEGTCLATRLLYRVVNLAAVESLTVVEGENQTLGVRHDAPGFLLRSYLIKDGERPVGEIAPLLHTRLDTTALRHYLSGLPVDHAIGKSNHVAFVETSFSRELKRSREPFRHCGERLLPLLDGKCPARILASVYQIIEDGNLDGVSLDLCDFQCTVEQG